MFDEIERFVNWIHRRHPGAHTWQDYHCDLQQFATIVGERSIAWSNAHTSTENKAYLRKLVDKIPLELGDLKVGIFVYPPK